MTRVSSMDTLWKVKDCPKTVNEASRMVYDNFWDPLCYRNLNTSITKGVNDTSYKKLETLIVVKM